MPAYTPIPLPQTRALPPPRRYANHGFYDDDAADDADADPELFRPYPERIREHEPELVRSRERRDRSRDARSARSRAHRSSASSRSSSISTSRSSSSADAATARAHYPRRGKTKIPIKLVSKRALVDLGYPFFEEGNTIVQRALGQENIDELLKLSDDYNKVDLEVAAALSTAGNLLEDSREEPLLVPPPPPSVHSPSVHSPPATAPPPSVVRAPPPPVSAVAPEVPAPPLPPPPPPPPAAVPVAPPATMPPPHVVEVGPPGEVMDRARAVRDMSVRDVSVRDVSPARSVAASTASSWDAPHRHHRHHPHRHHHHHHYDELVVHRSCSRSRSGREIRAEIKAFERELAHRPRGDFCDREIVRTERMPDGELIIYQDKVERRPAGPKPPRIEKDKKGRMSISIPKYR